MSYEVIKALHIISFVCWFAGLFYLPRLFVYHAQEGIKSAESNAMLKTMESKLYRYIMNPSMMATWFFGLWLLYLIPDYFTQGWMHVKLLFIVFLTGYHYICGRYVKIFADDQNKNPHKFFRFFNEIPTIILLVAVFMAVLKPF